MHQSINSSEVFRSTERLKGLLIGISIDNKINDIEIGSIYQWVMENEHLHYREPFKSTITLLKQILADGVVTEDERNELLEWCQYFSGRCHIPEEYATRAIRLLHGTVHGITLDGKITDTEINNFKSWLDTFKVFKDIWPFCDFISLVDHILEDGVITPSERNEFYRFCSEFSETIILDAVIQDQIYQENWMKTGCPVFRPFTYYCDRDVSIVFENKCFCFTGPARYGARSALNKIVISLGGSPKNNISSLVDYLVIGAQSSPCWAYSTYGRKIEAAIKIQKEGGGITILHEDDFLKQALS